MLHSCGNLVIFFSYSNYLHISVTQIFKLFFFLKMVKANKILNYLSTTASRLYVGATGLPNGFLRQKTSVFRFWCSLRFVNFSFFSIRFSVFVENNSSFSVLSSKWFVFGFRFWPNFLAVLQFWMIFSSVLRFLIYRNVPLS